MVTFCSCGQKIYLNSPRFLPTAGLVTTKFDVGRPCRPLGESWVTPRQCGLDCHRRRSPPDLRLCRLQCWKNAALQTGSAHRRRMPLTATRVGGPQWRTARAIDHGVAVVLDHKECSGMSPGVRRPHRCSSGVLDHQVAVSLHRDETGSSAVRCSRPERSRSSVQNQVSVNLVYQPEPSIGGLAKLAGQ